MSSYAQELAKLAEQLVEKLSAAQIVLSTAESCTGGLIGKVITDVSGSSSVYDRGFITYANNAKIEMLGIQRSELVQHGAVSEQIARAMAAGAMQKSGAHITLSTTGIAGPTGGTKDKPVGTVCFAWQVADELHSATKYFSGNREDVRFQASIYSIKQLLEQLG